MPRDDHVAAIFPDRHFALEAVTDLKAAGIALSMAAIPGLAVGGILALLMTGAAWGAIFGSLIGAGVGDVEWTQHENFAFEHLAGDEILVIVKSHEREQLCRQIFTRHGGRLLTDGTHPD